MGVAPARVARNLHAGKAVRRRHLLPRMTLAPADGPTRRRMAARRSLTSSRQAWVGPVDQVISCLGEYPLRGLHPTDRLWTKK